MQTGQQERRHRGCTVSIQQEYWLTNWFLENCLKEDEAMIEFFEYPRYFDFF
jgi:hypothetical protein